MMIMLTVATPSAFCQAAGDINAVMASLEALTATNERAVYCIDGLRLLSEAERLLTEEDDAAYHAKVSRWRLVYEQEDAVAVLDKAVDDAAYTLTMNGRTHRYYAEQWQQVAAIVAAAVPVWRETNDEPTLRSAVQTVWADLAAVPDKTAVIDGWAYAVKAAAQAMDDDLSALVNEPRLQNGLPTIAIPDWNVAVARDDDDTTWTAQVDTSYRQAYDEAWQKSVTASWSAEVAQAVLAAHEAAIVAMENSDPHVTEETLTAIAATAVRSWQGLTAELSEEENEVLTARQEAIDALDAWTQSKAADKLDEADKQQAEWLVQAGKETIATCQTVDDVRAAEDWYSARLQALIGTAEDSAEPWLWVAVAIPMLAVLIVALLGVLKWRKDRRPDSRQTQQDALALLEQWKQEALRQKTENKTDGNDRESTREETTAGNGSGCDDTEPMKDAEPTKQETTDGNDTEPTKEVPDDSPTTEGAEREKAPDDRA